MTKILLLTLALTAVCGTSQAATTVNAGSINNVTGPGSVDLTNIVYAVRFSPDGPQTVNGVTFATDSLPPVGFSSSGPNLLGSWQTKPEFGATADDNALEEIYHDIRWTNQGVFPPEPNLTASMDVTPGQMYRLQVLIPGNIPENRIWDIQVEGTLVVDNITSLGVDTGSGPPPYSLNRGILYSYDFLAGDSTVNVALGQIGGAPFPGGPGTDANAIWSGITLATIVPEPSAAMLAGLAALGLLRRRR